MTRSSLSETAAGARDRHAALIATTEAAVDSLPPLPPDATPQSFPALKAGARPGSHPDGAFEGASDGAPGRNPEQSA